MIRNIPEPIPKIPCPFPSTYDIEVPKIFFNEGIIIRENHFLDLIQYISDKHLKPVSVEKCIFDRQLRMAGTIDCIFENVDTHELLLYDWKRRPNFTTENRWETGLKNSPMDGMSDSNYSHALVQLNLYKNLITRGEGIKISSMHIITIHPSLPKILDNLIEIDNDLVDKMISFRLQNLNI